MKQFLINNKISSVTAFVCLAFILISYKTRAQQDPQYTNYMYNLINVNPAYAGNKEALSLFILHRSQWIGLDGAPITNTASIHSPLKNSNIGLGLSIINDRIGPSDENTISIDFSYGFDISEDYKISFGIKTTANLLNVDYTKLNIDDINDVEFQNNIDNRFTPNIGTGIFINSSKSYFGISVPNFLETRHFNDNTASTAKEKLHFYTMGGYVFDLSENTKFKPAFISKLVNGAPPQIDLTANFMFNEKFVLGTAWRWNAALSGLAGFQINNQLMIGYTYDSDTSRLANYNSGSHEIFLQYEFAKKTKKLICPRFF